MCIERRRKDEEKGVMRQREEWGGDALRVDMWEGSRGMRMRRGAGHLSSRRLHFLSRLLLRHALYGSSLRLLRSPLTPATPSFASAHSHQFSRKFYCSPFSESLPPATGAISLSSSHRLVGGVCLSLSLSTRSAVQAICYPTQMIILLTRR